MHFILTYKSGKHYMEKNNKLYTKTIPKAKVRKMRPKPKLGSQHGSFNLLTLIHNIMYKLSCDINSETVSWLPARCTFLYNYLYIQNITYYWAMVHSGDGMKWDLCVIDIRIKGEDIYRGTSAVKKAVILESIWRTS